MNDQKCPKCGSQMEMGFMVDRSHVFVPLKQHWAEGEKVKSFGKERMLKTKTYRCKNCGFLESFAIDKIKIDINIRTSPRAHVCTSLSHRD